MMTIAINFIFAIGAIWLMLFVWIKVTARHQVAMKDVDPCRQRAGCVGCTLNCQKEPHE